MVNWRIEGTDEQGRTRFVEYERGDYRADPLTDRELGEEEPLFFLGPSFARGNPRGSEWNWFQAGRHHLRSRAGCGTVRVTGQEPEQPLAHRNYGPGCCVTEEDFVLQSIADHNPVEPLIEDIYQVFRRTRDFPLKEELPRCLADEVGQSFIDDILDANPAIVRRCRAIQWVRLPKEPGDYCELEDYRAFVEEAFGPPADEAEVGLAARYPRMYVTETRNLLRLEVIARLGDALRHKLPEALADDLARAVEVSLATRDTTWPRYLDRE